MSNDFLQNLDQQKPERKKRSSLLAFNRAVDISRDDANQAAGGKRGLHGRKKQLTTRVPEKVHDELIENIKHFADALGMYQNDVQLWALLRGIQALTQGEQPELERAVTKRSLKL
jgi:hypothetical protein